MYFPWIMARQVMGQNFFGVEEAMKHFGVIPTQRDLEELATFPFTLELLEACKDTHVLVAEFPISVKDLCQLKNVKCREVSVETGINSLWQQPCMLDEGKAKWQLVRKNPLQPVSFPFGSKYLLKGTVPPGGDIVPNAKTLVYTAVAHFLSSKEHLFEDVLLWTDDWDFSQRNFCVGFLDPYDTMSLTIARYFLDIVRFRIKPKIVLASAKSHWASS